MNGLTRKEIFDILKVDLKAPAAEVYNKIEKVMSEKVEKSFTLTDKNKGFLRTLVAKLKSKWEECCRFETKFLEKNDAWLKVFIKINLYIVYYI